MPIKPKLLAGARSTIQNQIPYAPWRSSLPASNDPLSQDGSLVIIDNGSYSISNGLYGYDARTQPPKWRQILSLNGYFLIGTNTTPVTVNANTTSEQNLLSLALPDNILNQIGRAFRITSKGVYVVNAAGTDFSVRNYLNSTAISDHVLTLNPTGTLVDLGWRSIVEFIVTADGVTGTIETSWHGKAAVSTATGPAESSIDARVSDLSIDLTGAQTLQIKCLFSVASANNACSQRILMVEKLN